MYYVYVLYNKQNNKIYIGQTEDIEKRLRMHEEKRFGSSFTSRFEGEWLLIYKEEVKDRKAALVREKQLKSYRGREYVKKFIPL